jgi:hypothetical protein
MKQSMQVIATIAFLGCFSILVIAAGSKKAKQHEACGEEWKKALHKEEVKKVSTVFPADTKAVAICIPENNQDILLPVQLFHAIL